MTGILYGFGDGFGVVAAVEDRTEDLLGAGRLAQRMADSVAAVLLARAAGVEHGGEALQEKYVNVRKLGVRVHFISKKP